MPSTEVFGLVYAFLKCVSVTFYSAEVDCLPWILNVVAIMKVRRPPTCFDIDEIGFAQFA